jgi:hypothetical protein
MVKPRDRKRSAQTSISTATKRPWLWLRHQPQSALTLWFKERVSGNGGHFKKSTIVALARKLLVEICHRRRRHRRSRDEGRLTIDAQQIIKSPRT